MPNIQLPAFSIECPMYDCAEVINLTERQFRTNSVRSCPHCGTAIWPYLKGFTGNIPEENNRFARTHNLDGSPV